MRRDQSVVDLESADLWEANEGSVSGYATGAVSGTGTNVGGLVGGNGDQHYKQFNAPVSGYATGTVSGDYQVGGLVGLNIIGSTVNGYATGAVNGNHIVGGLWDKVVAPRVAMPDAALLAQLELM